MTQEEKLAKVKENIEAISKRIVLHAEELADDIFSCGALNGDEHYFAIAKYTLMLATKRKITFIRQEELELSNLSKFI
jgi:hypothetical protein